MNFESIKKLIEEGNENEAAKLILSSEKQRLSAILRKHGWKNGTEEGLIYEAVAKVVKKIRDGYIVENITASLVQTAKYLGANLARKNHQKLHVITEELDEQILGYWKLLNSDGEYFEYLSPSAGLWLEVLRKAMKAIDNNCKKHITLKFYEELSHEEIARRMSNISNAKSSASKLNRCMERLKNLVKDYL